MIYDDTQDEHENLESTLQTTRDPFQLELLNAVKKRRQKETGFESNEIDKELRHDDALDLKMAKFMANNKSYIQSDMMQRESSSQRMSPDSLWSPGTSQINKPLKKVKDLIPSIEVSTDEDIGIGSDDDLNKTIVRKKDVKQNRNRQSAITENHRPITLASKKTSQGDLNDKSRDAVPRPGLIKRPAFHSDLPDEHDNETKISKKLEENKAESKSESKSIKGKDVKTSSKYNTKGDAVSLSKGSELHRLVNSDRNNKISDTDNHQIVGNAENKDKRKFGRSARLEDDYSDSDDEIVNAHNAYRRQMKDSGKKLASDMRGDREHSSKMTHYDSYSSKQGKIKSNVTTKITAKGSTDNKNDDFASPQPQHRLRGSSHEDGVRVAEQVNSISNTPRSGLVDDIFSSDYRRPRTGSDRSVHSNDSGKQSRSGSNKEENLERSHSRSSKEDHSSRPRSSSNKDETSARPRSGSGKEGYLARPRSGSNKEDNSQRPRSGSDKQDSSQRPQSGLNKQDSSQRPQSGLNQEDNLQRSRAGPNKQDNALRSRSGSIKEENSKRQQTGPNKEAHNERPRSGSNKESRSDFYTDSKKHSSMGERLLSNEMSYSKENKSRNSKLNLTRKNGPSFFDENELESDGGDSDYEINASFRSSKYHENKKIEKSKTSPPSRSRHKRTGSLGSALITNNHFEHQQSQDPRHRSKSDIEENPWDASMSTKKFDKDLPLRKSGSLGSSLHQKSSEDTSNYRDNKTSRNRNSESVNTSNTDRKPRIKGNLGPDILNKSKSKSPHINRRTHIIPDNDSDSDQAERKGRSVLSKTGPLKANPDVAGTTGKKLQKTTPIKPNSQKSPNKRSQSFTNISNISPKSPYMDEDSEKRQSQVVDSSSLREQIYYDWLKKKDSHLKTTVVKKRQTEKEKEEEVEKEKQEKQIMSQKAFEAWSANKGERSKETLSLVQDKKKMEKQKLEEMQQKKMDSKKYFESWKAKKDETLIENHRKKKGEEREKRQKELEEKEDKISSAKKVYDNWKSKKDEMLKDKTKQKKAQEKEKRMIEYEKQEKKKNAEKAFENWKDKKPRSLHDTGPALTQRAWCPSSRNCGNVVPQHVQPVIQRNPPNRSRTLSASARLSLGTLQTTSSRS